MTTDDENSEKSHFEYVFCYACLLYSAFNGDNLAKELFPEKMLEEDQNQCKEPEISQEDIRNRAKEMLISLCSLSLSSSTKQNSNVSSKEESKEKNKEKDNEDEEENITFESDNNESKDITLQVDFIDRLGELRETIKQLPTSIELIKHLGQPVMLDKDNEVMIGFVHSAS
mmetsp:Transcript_1886/g.2347  ORF Transcript_1886/g.2347 Transcript_1886/m.2347 type:complete len:171 (+) Transcript_1886:2173-2685(+)